MQNLTPAGQNIVNDIAARYNLSVDSTIHMLVAVNQGSGTMAQFSIPELGSGQWMRGGMTMCGDMFNHGLQATVNNLCEELSNALASTQMFPVIPAGSPGSNQWWPGDLGYPFSSGGQNDIRYAVFPNRLAVEKAGQVTVYDTLDHQIGGVSQQQGGNDSLTFSSQYGTIAVSSLPIVSEPGNPPQPATNFAEPTPAPVPSAPPQQTHNQYSPQEQPLEASISPSIASSGVAAGQSIQSQSDIIDLLEKLGKLRDAGILSPAEFNSKKIELMARI